MFYYLLKNVVSYWLNPYTVYKHHSNRPTSGLKNDWKKELRKCNLRERKKERKKERERERERELDKDREKERERERERERFLDKER